MHGAVAHWESFARPVWEQSRTAEPVTDQAASASRRIPFGRPEITRFSRHFGKEFGAAEGTRTPDPIITNDVLYQLSYSGLVAGY